MKLLIFTDVHSNLKIIHKLIEKSKKENPDLLICSGDISEFGKNLEKILLMFKSTNKPLIILHGNHELEEELKIMSKKFDFIIFLHKKLLKINNYTFLGYGGSGFSYRDKDFEFFIKKHASELKKSNLILITHAPPYKTKLDQIHNNHYGNLSIKRFIREFKPVIHICGHFHENFGKTNKLQNTLLINPGPFGKIINLNENQ